MPSSNQPMVYLPKGPWGRRVLGPRSSQEGGTERPYHHWWDALQLAALAGAQDLRPATKAGIEARAAEIHEQLMRWPQIPFSQNVV
jgi:hypothetical protein